MWFKARPVNSLSDCFGNKAGVEGGYRPGPPEPDKTISTCQRQEESFLLGFCFLVNPAVHAEGFLEPFGRALTPCFKPGNKGRLENSPRQESRVGIEGWNLTAVLHSCNSRSSLRDVSALPFVRRLESFLMQFQNRTWSVMSALEVDKAGGVTNHQSPEISQLGTGDSIQGEWSVPFLPPLNQSFFFFF